MVGSQAVYFQLWKPCSASLSSLYGMPGDGIRPVESQEELASSVRQVGAVVQVRGLCVKGWWGANNDIPSTVGR